MSHVLHVTCHTCYIKKYQLTNNFTKGPMCYIFLESSGKMQFNGLDENKLAPVKCRVYILVRYQLKLIFRNGRSTSTGTGEMY